MEDKVKNQMEQLQYLIGFKKKLIKKLASDLLEDVKRAGENSSVHARYAMEKSQRLNECYIELDGLEKQYFMLSELLKG